MNFKNILPILSLISLCKACSFLPDYSCCSPGTEVVYVDEQGNWGVENDKWCGIEEKEGETCWSLPYPCCEGNEVVYTDERGEWGVENDEWCGIVKDITTTTKNSSTTTATTTTITNTTTNTKANNKGTYVMEPFIPTCNVVVEEQTDCVGAWSRCGGGDMEEKCCFPGMTCKGDDSYKQCEPDPNAELRPATSEKGPHGSNWCELCNYTEEKNGFLWGFENGQPCEIKMCECHDILNREPYDPSEYKYPVGTKKGKTTRYWDCCKPSCSWPDKALVSEPVRQCAADGITPITDYNAKSACEGGSSYMCTDQRPWAVSETLSYGYAAASIQGLTEAEWCCRCYALTFTSELVKGKQMVVQVTNTGGDLEENHFDIQIPGGGFGLFDGCTSQFKLSKESWGSQFGGISKRTDCDQLPEALVESCYWRFDWFLNSDNPSMVFEEVECPLELTQNTGCIHQ